MSAPSPMLGIVSFPHRKCALCYLGRRGGWLMDVKDRREEPVQVDGKTAEWCDTTTLSKHHSTKKREDIPKQNRG